MAKGRDYSRMERVNELCREILADELERVDDVRLDLVTVTYVQVDPDLRRATVFFSALGRGEDEAAEALAEHRAALQRAIARQARIKRTPELRFRVDDVIESSARIERILAEERARRGDGGGDMGEDGGNGTTPDGGRGE
jgi:ribosome-binding factor A